MMEQGWLGEAVLRFSNEGIYDPHEIASELMGELSEEALHFYAHQGLVYNARRMIHVRRGQASTTQEVPMRGWQWPVGGVWKPIEDWTQDEVRSIIEDYEARGQQMLARRDEFQRILDLMIEQGAQTIGDLSAGVKHSAAEILI